MFFTCAAITLAILLRCKIVEIAALLIPIEGTARTTRGIIIIPNNRRKLRRWDSRIRRNIRSDRSQTAACRANEITFRAANVLRTNHLAIVITGAAPSRTAGPPLVNKTSSSILGHPTTTGYLSIIFQRIQSR